MGECKTALFGGSFDPIHLGHLFLLHCAITKTDCQRFIIVPAYMSNFKRDKNLSASPQDRLKMIEIALEDYRKIYPQDRNVIFEISDYELNKGGVSYTYDTIMYLINKYNLNEPLGLLMGDDHIERLTEWYKFDEFKDKVQFLICPRNAGHDIWRKLPAGISYQDIGIGKISEASATRVRDDLSSYQTDLSDGVRDYVRANHLYN